MQAELREWFEQAGFGGRKLESALATCEEQDIESVEDLTEMHFAARPTPASALLLAAFACARAGFMTGWAPGMRAILPTVPPRLGSSAGLATARLARRFVVRAQMRTVRV